jgi:chitinase
MKLQKMFVSLILVLLTALVALLGSAPGAGMAAKPPTPTPPGPTATPVPVSSRRIVGYFVQWGIYRRNYLVKNVHASGSAQRLTHVNYAFANISPDLKCASGDAFADYNKAFSASESVDGVADPSTATTLRGNFNQLRKLKLMYPHLKVLISVGGWSWSDYFSDAALPANRAAFVASCIDMYLKGNFSSTLQGFDTVFDGIDIDWEYPGACGETCNFRPEDTQNFTALLAEFRTQLNALSATTGRPYLLTIASPAGESYFTKIELGNIHPYLDFINVMTYDFHGTWESTTNFHTPLYASSSDPSPGANSLNANYAVQAYLNAGIPGGKLVLGVPFYGRGWKNVAPGPNEDGLYQDSAGPARGKYENGVNDYKELVGLEASYSRYRHPEAQAFYIYNGNVWWTYDDPTSMTNKMNYVKAQGLSGAMFWELSGDTANIGLLNAIYLGLQ